MNNFQIRTARPNDLPRIKQIIRQAKTLLKVRQVDQWQDGYPNEEILQDDLARGKGYVLETRAKCTAILPCRLRTKFHTDALNRVPGLRTGPTACCTALP